MDIIAFILADIAYICSFIFYGKMNVKRGEYFLFAGIVLHSVSIVGRWMHTGTPPFFTLYEILLFFSWALVFLSLFTKLYKHIGRWVALAAVIILGIICFLNPGTKTLPAELNTILFPLHVSSCMMGYGAFFIAFVCSVLLFVKKRYAGNC